MSTLGIGQDGYLRVQKESVFGTGVTNSMTLLPVKPETNLKSVVQQIENANIMGSRVRQAPNIGRTKIDGEIIMDGYPSLLGLVFNLLFGTSADAVSDSAYEHTFLAPMTNSVPAKSFTAQQAHGSDTAEQMNGGIILSMKIASDSQGNVVFSFKTFHQSLTDAVTRITSFSYPAETAYKFSHLSCVIDPLLPANDAAITLSMDSFELEYMPGYTEENFKIGSITSAQPVVDKSPTVTMKATINADGRYDGYARTIQTFSAAIQLLHTEYAAGTVPFRTQIEIPKMRLVSDTVTPNGNDLLKMDLNFMADFGGTTTGGGSDTQIMEVRHRDAVAAYA